MFGSHWHAGADRHFRDRADHFWPPQASGTGRAPWARASPNSSGRRTSCRARSKRKSASKSSRSSAEAATAAPRRRAAAVA